MPERSSKWSARVEKIILTASGGPFLGRDLKTFVTSRQNRLAHTPTGSWEKISVDSATMMNKALEVIEAKYLICGLNK